MGELHALGALVPVYFSVTDAAGAATNPTTAVLTVTKPDGTTDTPSVNLPPAVTGRPGVDYLPTATGRYEARMVTTVPTGAFATVFYVRSGSPRWISSPAEVQALLNGQGDLEQISELLHMATAVVESRIGPVANQTFIEKHPGGAALALRHPPVVSVTSVVGIRSGVPDLTVGDLDVDGPTGVVERVDGGVIAGPVRVTYVAGRANQTPEEAVIAAAEIAAHMWRRDHGMGTDTFGGVAPDEVPTGFGFAVPRAAMEMIRHLRNDWGV